MTADEKMSALAELLDIESGHMLQSATVVYDLIDTEGTDRWGCDLFGTSTTTNRLGVMRLAEHRILDQYEHEQDD